ncbi:MAG TPA: hypothetical protein VGK41_08280 [Solirubrobacterales bacterium]
MGLKIKHYAKTGHIRSVGDPPNGLVAVSLHGAPHFVISPKTKPPPTGQPGEITVRVQQGADPEQEEEGAVAITVEEAIEASLHCKRTPWVLWGAAHVAVLKAVDGMLDSFDVEGVQAAATFAKELRDQLAVNGLIHQGRRR